MTELYYLILSAQMLVDPHSALTTEYRFGWCSLLDNNIYCFTPVQLLRSLSYLGIYARIGWGGGTLVVPATMFYFVEQHKSHIQFHLAAFKSFSIPT